MRLGVIGTPTSAGAYAPGQEQAPRALREAGLVERLSVLGVDVVDHGDTPTWRWRPDPANPRAQNLHAAVEGAAQTASRVRAALGDGEAVLVLGGDCTVGLGTIAGHLPTSGRLGVVYFDIHADLNTPESVRDGALDWMGVAHLLGEPEATRGLTEFGPHAPLLENDQIVLFGHGREQSTDWELDAISRRGLLTVPVTDVADDPAAAAGRALAMLAACDRLVVHFDVDTIDFTDAPLSENTGRNVGLTRHQAFSALAALVCDPRFSALTITELNPAHGADDGSTIVEFADRLAVALSTAPNLRTHRTTARVEGRVQP
jgi:arginase